MAALQAASKASFFSPARSEAVWRGVKPAVTEGSRRRETDESTVQKRTESRSCLPSRTQQEAPELRYSQRPEDLRVRHLALRDWLHEAPLEVPALWREGVSKPNAQIDGPGFGLEFGEKWNEEKRGERTETGFSGRYGSPARRAAAQSQSSTSA